MILLEHGVVEEDHHPVAGEVLERAAVLDDRLAHRPVVLAQDAEQLLGLGVLGEGGEAAQVAEDRCDLPPMAGQQLLALGLETRAATWGERNRLSSSLCRSIVAVSAVCRSSDSCSRSCSRFAASEALIRAPRI